MAQRESWCPNRNSSLDKWASKPPDALHRKGESALQCGAPWGAGRAEGFVAVGAPGGTKRHRHTAPENPKGRLSRLLLTGQVATVLRGGTGSPWSLWGLPRAQLLPAHHPATSSTHPEPSEPLALLSPNLLLHEEPFLVKRVPERHLIFH